MLLSKVQVSNFKSFKGQEITFLPRGMNCITGPNGFGKSNLLDAISFSLCSPASKLRVQAESDLILKNVLATNNVRTCHVILTFDNSSKLVPDYSDLQYELLTKVICDDKSTATLHQLNGKTKTKKDIKKFLSDIGLDIEDPGFIVYQNSVVQLPFLKPQQLALQILDATGTKTFHEHIKQAKRDMESWKVSEEVILGNIQLLETRLEEDSKELRMDKEIKLLKDKLRRMESTIKNAEENEQRNRASTLLAEISKTEQLLSAYNDELQGSERVMKESNALAADRTTQVNQLVKQITDGEKALEQLNENIAEQEEFQRIDETEAKKSEERGMKRARERQELLQTKTEIADQLVAMRNKRCELEYQIVQMNFELDKAARLKSKDDIEKKMTDLTAELALVKNQTQEHRDSITKCQEKEVSYQKERQRFADQVPTVHSRSDIKQREAVCRREYQTVVKSKEILREKLKDIESKMQTARTKLNLDHITKHSSGDLGPILELFEIRADSEEYLEALNQIFKSFMNVRVTLDSTTATQLLKEPDHNMRIWALDRLDYKDNELKMRRIVGSFDSGRVIYPVDLLLFKEHLKPAIYRIFGPTLIVRDEKTGEEIVKQFGVRVITLKGTVMSPGLMTGGFLNNKENLIRIKMDLVQLSRDCAVLKAEYDALKRSEIELENTLRTLERELENEKAIDKIAKFDGMIKENATQMLQINETIEQGTTRALLIEEQLSQLRIMCNSNSVVNTKSVNIKALTKQKVTCEKELVDVSENIFALETRLTSLDIDLEQLQGDEATPREFNDNSLNLADLRRDHEKLSLEVNSLTKLKVQYEKEIKRLQQDAIEANAVKQELVKKSAVLNKQLAQLNKEKSRMKLNASNQEDRMDIEIDVEELKYSVDETNKQLKKLKNERRELLKVKPVRADPALIEQKERNLKEFKNKIQLTQQSIKELANGVTYSIEKIAEANDAAFEIVRKEFAKQFASVVPNKRADILRVNPDGPLEEGVYFVIADKNSDEWREGLNELSGGEKTLLAMSFILSTATFKKRSLYIFDEVDAGKQKKDPAQGIWIRNNEIALDELNSSRLASLITSTLGSAQVICVSHNRNFSKQGAREIQITKEGFYSKVAKAIDRRD